ncbi:hypothetical protein KCU84_g114, partial [Aureobasidium melanogenum]
MRQAIEDRNVSDCDDPFSALGKTIVTGPTRSVLHVPYLPGRSIQDEHIRLTNQADLTIVAIIQTAESQPASDLAGQLYFAKAIAMKSGTANMCCIQCNVVNFEIGSAYDNVIISPSHTRSDLEVVAKLVNGLLPLLVEEAYKELGRANSSAVAKVARVVNKAANPAVKLLYELSTRMIDRIQISNKK